MSQPDSSATAEALARLDAITRRLRPLMGHTRFEFFPVPGSDLPLTWDQMKAPVRSQQNPDRTR